MKKEMVSSSNTSRSKIAGLTFGLKLEVMENFEGESLNEHCVQYGQY